MSWLVVVLLVTLLQWCSGDWRVETLDNAIGCLYGDLEDLVASSDELLCPPFKNTSTALDSLNSISFSFFLFGEGPMDLSCNDPFQSFSALLSCGGGENDSPTKCRPNRMQRLCNEGEERLRLRLRHCVSGKAWNRLSMLSDEEVGQQSLLCVVSLRCTLDKFINVCSSLIIATSRRREFCDPQSHAHKMVTRNCRRLWNGVKWKEFLASLDGDSHAETSTLDEVLSYVGRHVFLGAGTAASATERIQSFVEQGLAYVDAQRHFALSQGLDVRIATMINRSMASFDGTFD